MPGAQESDKTKKSVGNEKVLAILAKLVYNLERMLISKED